MVEEKVSNIRREARRECRRTGEGFRRLARQVWDSIKVQKGCGLRRKVAELEVERIPLY